MTVGFVIGQHSSGAELLLAGSEEGGPQSSAEGTKAWGPGGETVAIGTALAPSTLLHAARKGQPPLEALGGL